MYSIFLDLENSLLFRISPNAVDFISNWLKAIRFLLEFKILFSSSHQTVNNVKTLLYIVMSQNQPFKCFAIWTNQFSPGALRLPQY